MMEHVKEVLADPKSVYPDYDVKEGYELAGFVWFQGFNDLVGPYPRVDPSTGKKSSKDYSEYSRLLACFIRDVRKELSAPKMPFVTGVLGVGGKATNENTVAFRKGMSAPAEMKEFKGNVVNVFTENYWPTELDVLLAKTNEFKNESKRKAKELKVKEMSREDRQKAQAKNKDEMRANIEKALTKDELFLLDNGMSNQGYHYYGSAKCLGQIGRAFAEALVELKKR